MRTVWQVGGLLSSKVNQRLLIMYSRRRWFRSPGLVSSLSRSPSANDLGMTPIEQARAPNTHLEGIEAVRASSVPRDVFFDAATEPACHGSKWARRFWAQQDSSD